jgi:hypothetical protein
MRLKRARVTPDPISALKDLVAACANATVPLVSVKAVRDFSRLLKAVENAKAVIAKAEDGK